VIGEGRPAGVGSRVLQLAIASLMVLPPVVAIACLAGRPWHPTDDFAIIDIRVRDVFTRHTPLTGLYSRPGWNHPGPISFWMIRAVSIVANGAPWGTRIGGTVVQAVALGWLAWVTSKSGMRMLLAAATVTSLTFLAITPDVFRQPWNPWIPLPFFVLFIFLVCLVATGAFRQLIGMSIAGTVIVQNHVGYAPLIAAGFAWAIGCVVVDYRRDHTVPVRWRSTMIITGAVVAVLWLPPVIGVATHTPGDLSVLVRYFLSGGHSSVGLHAAVGIMAAQFRFLPPWLGGRDTPLPLTSYARSASALWLVVPVALLVLGGFAAKRSGARSDARMVGFAALLLGVGMIAVSRADEPRGYTFEWRFVVAAFVVVASLWAIARAVQPSPTSRQRTIAIGLIVAVATWGSAVRAVSETTGRPAFLEARDATLLQLMNEVNVRSIPKRTKILVRYYGTDLPSLFDGVVDALDRAGIDVRVDAFRARVFGSQRVGTAGAADEVWYVTEQGSLVPALDNIPNAHVIAATHPLPRKDDAELTRMQQVLLRENPRLLVDSPLVAFLTANDKGVDQTDARRVALLDVEVDRNGGCRCAIVAVAGPSRLIPPAPLRTQP
jgi:hypothetical protein